MSCNMGMGKKIFLCTYYMDYVLYNTQWTSKKKTLYIKLLISQIKWMQTEILLMQKFIDERTFLSEWANI